MKDLYLLVHYEYNSMFKVELKEDLIFGVNRRQCLGPLQKNAIEVTKIHIIAEIAYRRISINIHNFRVFSDL
jgi:hypothetical protein